MSKEIKHSEMAAAVIWWLNYINAIGRGYVINENAIKYPVSEYLEKSICEKEKIKLERNHPILWKRSIDICYNKGGQEVAFELKYIKDGSTLKQSEKQRVFNDLMRLFYFVENGGKGYFLICGLKSEFKQSFMQIPIPTNTNLPIPSKTLSYFYEEWFSFNDKPSEKIIDLNIINSTYKVIYDKFFTDYKPKKNKVMARPNSITTKLIFLSQELIDSNIPENLRIGIWEVTK